MDKFGKDALGIAVAVNIAIFAVLGSISFGGCLSDEAKPKEEVIIPMDFTVVTEENAADVLAEAPNAAAKAEPKPEAKPRQEPKPEAKPRQEAKTKTKKEPEKPKWKATSAKDIKKGKRVGPVTSGRKDRTRAPTAKALSAAEIQQLLNAGARPGNRNQVPPSEDDRCSDVIERVFHEACAGLLEASPTGRAPSLRVTFGAGGAVRGVALSQSSGDRAFDAQVLATCRQVKRVDGLSDVVLRKWNYVVEIRVWRLLMPR